MHAGILVSLVLSVSLSLGSATAQEVAGRIEGRVRDTTGLALPDVQLTVTSPSLLGGRATKTDVDGRFLLQALPVGTYRIAARRIGFRPLVLETVRVRLGETASLPHLTLTPALVELEEISVSAANPGLDPASTASRLILDDHQLDALPVSRNYRDIALLAPTAIPSYLGRAGGIPDGTNIGGATGLENSYYVDGINITDVIHGSTSLDLPYNFVRQIEVRTGGSTGERQALGGVVNVVTPSGGDRVRGGLFGFYSGDALQTEAQMALGSTQSGFTSYDVGGVLSGPMVPGRLWFFGAYNHTSEAREHTLPFGKLSDLRRQHLFAGKLTWSAGPHTSAIFTVLGDPSSLEPLGFPLFGGGVPQNSEVLQETGKAGGVGLSIQGRHFLRPNLLIEGAVAQITRDQEDEPATTAGRAPVVIDVTNGTLYGGNGGAGRIDSRRRSVDAALSWHTGAHSVRAGASYESLFMDQTIDISRTGAGGTITRLDTALWSWHSAYAESGRAENRNPTAFLEDAWQINERTLLNAGLRWSRQSVHNVNTETMSFRVDDGVQPRLGLVYQPGRLGTQRVYASYGRVANQIVLWGAAENAVGAETLFVFPQDPRVDTTGGSIVYAVPRDGRGLSGDGTLRGETAEEWAIGYERKIATNFELSVRGVLRAHRDAVQVGDDTLGVLYWGNPGRGKLAHFPRARRTYHAVEFVLDHAAGPGSPWLRLSYVLSRTHGNYPGLYGSDWRLDFAHYGPLYVTPEQHVNGNGLLPNDRTHVLKLFGSQQIGSRLTVGTAFLLASGTPLSEYGAIQIPPPFRGLVRQRGTAGRTPTIWDLSLRLGFDLPSPVRSGPWTKLLVDWEHIGSPRKPVDYDQIHFTCLDEEGSQSCPNVGYGREILYQPPMTLRLGIEARF